MFKLMCMGRRLSQGPLERGLKNINRALRRCGLIWGDTGQALGMLRTEVTKVAGKARTQESYLETLGLFEMKFRNSKDSDTVCCQGSLCDQAFLSSRV